MMMIDNDSMLTGLTSWPGGEMWCKTAVFFDYYLATLHPLFIIMLCIILYTRKLPPKQDLVMPPAPVMHSRMSARSGYTQRTGSQRPPSVAGSVQSASRHDGTFRKGFSKREGSVNGSTAGSVSGNVSRGPAPYHSNTPQRKISHNSSINSGRHNMRGAQAAPARTSSPLSQVHEDKYAESVDGELWEMASMEYPGRNDLDLEFDDEEDYVPDEPRLREWMKWVVMTMWLLGLGIGAVALEQAQYSDQRPPGCYLAPDKALLAKGRHNYFIRDPTINLLLSTVTINYIVPGIFFIMCSVLLCTTRWTQDGKLNRFFKMCIGLCVMFLASRYLDITCMSLYPRIMLSICFRSSVDILQFRDIIHTSQGISITNKRPDQLENEVLLFWAAIIPVVGNPIIYLFCVTEYRQNIINMWRVCTQGKNNQL